MATITTNMNRIGAAVGRAFSHILDSQSRTREFDRLSAKSDSELARMGLQRQDIARHVFRDYIGL